MRLLLHLLLLPFVLAAQPVPKDYVEICFSNPGGQIWKVVRQELLNPGGPAYSQQLLHANFPSMKGEVVSVPARNEMLVTITGAGKPEALLRVSGRIPDTLSKPGTKIYFTGTITAFRKVPFQLTVSVDADKITKWD